MTKPPFDIMTFWHLALPYNNCQSSIANAHALFPLFNDKWREKPEMTLSSIPSNTVILAFDHLDAIFNFR
jgi:hypothetical protein